MGNQNPDFPIESTLSHISYQSPPHVTVRNPRIAKPPFLRSCRWINHPSPTHVHSRITSHSCVCLKRSRHHIIFDGHVATSPCHVLSLQVTFPTRVLLVTYLQSWQWSLYYLPIRTHPPNYRNFNFMLTCNKMVECTGMSFWRVFAAQRANRAKQQFIFLTQEKSRFAWQRPFAIRPQCPARLQK